MTQAMTIVRQAEKNAICARHRLQNRYYRLASSIAYEGLRAEKEIRR